MHAYCQKVGWDCPVSTCFRAESFRRNLKYLGVNQGWGVGMGNEKNLLQDVKVHEKIQAELPPNVYCLVKQHYLLI